MDPQLLKSVLLPVIVPAVLATMGIFIVTLALGRSPVLAVLVAGLELAGAFLVGYFLIFAKIPLLPRESSHWIVYVPIVAALAAAALGKMTGAGRAALIALVVAGVTIVQVRSLWRVSWQPVESVWITTLIVILGTLGWAMLARVVESSRRAPAMIFLTALYTLAAITIVSSGSAALAQTLGIFTAIIGPFVLLAWWKPESPAFGAVPALATLALLSILVQARFYSDLTVVSTLLLLAAIFLAWLFTRLLPIRNEWVRFALALVPAAVAAGFAVRAAMKSSGEAW